MFFAVWEDVLPSGKSNIRGARFTAGGSVMDTPLLTVAANGHALITPAVAFDGAKFLVAWVDTSGSSEQVMAAFVDPAVSGDAAVGIAFNVTTGTGASVGPSVAGGGGDALLCWYHQPNAECTLFHNQVASGTVASLSVSDGLGAGDIVSGITVARGTTNFAVGYELEPFSVGNVPTQVRVALVDSGGTHPSQAVSTGSPPSGAPYVGDPAIAFDGTTYVVYFAKLNASFSYDIWQRSLTTGGTLAANDSRLATDPSSVYLRTQAVAYGSNQFFVAWQSDDGSGKKIMGGRYQADGTKIGTGDPSLLSSAVAQQLDVLPDDFDGLPHAIAIDSASHKVEIAWVGFTTSMRGATGTDVFALEADLSATTPPATLPSVSSTVLSLSKSFQRGYHAASNGNTLLLVWEDDRNFASSGVDVYGMRFGLDGKPLDAAPFAICKYVGDQITPGVGAIAGGDFYVVWSDGRDLAGGIARTAYGNRVGADGTIKDGDGVRLSANNAGGGGGAQQAPTVAGSTDGWLVAWEDWRNSAAISGSAQVFGTRVAASNGMPGTEQLIANDACGAAPAFDGKQFLVAYETPCSQLGNKGPSDIKAVWLSSSAVLGAAAIISAQSDSETSPPGVVGVRLDGALAMAEAPFPIEASSLFHADGQQIPGNFDGREAVYIPRFTPAPALAAAAGGETLIGYDLLENLDGLDVSRVHTRKLGLVALGGPCAAATACGQGICTRGACCDTPCDGICQACGAKGCVEVPPDESRCPAMPVSCSALLRLDDTVLVLAHHARIVVSTADKSVMLPMTMSSTVKTGLTVANYDADGDGRTDIVLELGPSYKMDRLNKFRLTPDGTATLGFSVQAQVFDGLGNAFARAPAVQAMLQPGTNTHAAELDPKCLNQCSDGTRHLTTADGQMIAFMGTQPTALAASGALLAAGAAHEADGGKPNVGLVQVWTSLAANPVSLKGMNAGDQFGAALAFADVNGDGKADLIVGAPGSDSDKGAAFLFDGPDFSTATKLRGVTAGDRVGVALAATGDKVLIGADGTATAYLAKGSDFGGDASKLPALTGPAGSRFGAAFAVDGNAVAVGAPAANTAFQPMLSDFAAPAHAAGSPIPAGNGGFGAALAFAQIGGKPTLVVGAPGASRTLVAGGQTLAGPNGLGAAVAVLPLGDGDAIVAGAPASFASMPGAGAVFAVRPATLAVAPIMQLDGMGTPAALSITGAHPGDGLGAALAVSDLDGDGFADLAVAAKQSIYVYKGPLP